MIDATGNTLLHLMMLCGWHPDTIEKVWKMNPEASRAINNEGKTPFDIAVAACNGHAIDLLQWSLTFDEIVHAYDKSVDTYTVFRFVELLRGFRL